MTLDIESRQLLAMLAAAGRPRIHESTPAIARMSGPELAAKSGSGPKVGEVRTVEVTVPHGSVRVRAIKPLAESNGIVVFYHGGGWVLSDIDFQYDTVARQLVEATECTIVLVNYRKAPENPFPTAVDDSFAALEWVDRNRDQLAPHGCPLIVAGDSAGGNLAAVMAQRSRDREGPVIDYQILIYPVTDCDLGRRSYLAPENQLLVSRDTMEWFWSHYVQSQVLRTHPDASPLRHPDLTGLPPAFIYLAEFDPLHDEGREYADRLAAAGNRVEIDTAYGQMHGFFQMANLLPGYSAGLQLVARKIREQVSIEFTNSALSDSEVERQIP